QARRTCREHTGSIKLGCASVRECRLSAQSDGSGALSQVDHQLDRLALCEVLLSRQGPMRVEAEGESDRGLEVRAPPTSDTPRCREYLRGGVPEVVVRGHHRKLT